LNAGLFGLGGSDPLEGFVDVVLVLVDLGSLFDCELDGVSIFSPVLIAEVAAGYLAHMFPDPIYLPGALL
jgi:hypothetical protein